MGEKREYEEEEGEEEKGRGEEEREGEGEGGIVGGIADVRRYEAVDNRKNGVRMAVGNIGLSFLFSTQLAFRFSPVKTEWICFFLSSGRDFCFRSREVLHLVDSEVCRL